MYLCPKQEATAVHLSVKEHRLSAGGLLVRDARLINSDSILQGQNRSNELRVDAHSEIQRWFGLFTGPLYLSRCTSTA